MLRMLVLTALVSTVAVFAGCKGEGDTFFLAVDTTAPTVTAIPPGGTYLGSINVVLFADENATIYYTTDGSDPDVGSAVYAAPILVAGDTVLKFFGIDAAGNEGAIVTESYVIYYASPLWTLPRNITDTTQLSQAPSLAAGTDGMAYLTWLQDEGADRNVLYANSAAWGTTARVSQLSSPENSSAQALAVDSAGVVHCLWRGNVDGGTNWEIFYCNSTDWSAATNLSNTTDFTQYVSIAVDSNDTVHLAWTQRFGGSQYDIVYTNSTIMPATQSVTSTPADSLNPSIAVDSNDTVHIAWQQQVGGYNQIYLADSTNWAASASIYVTPDNSSNPSIAFGPGDTLHAAWKEHVGLSTFQIYYANSTDWNGTRKDISATATSSDKPIVGVSPTGMVHMVWEEDLGGNKEIYYTDLTNYPCNITNLSNSSYNSTFPTFAIGPDGVLHVAWTQTIPTRLEIYYVRSVN